MEERIITFQSVYHAFRAKKVLENAGIPTRLIPIPRELSGSCEGLAASFDGNRCEEALAALEANRINVIKCCSKV